MEGSTTDQLTVGDSVVLDEGHKIKSDLTQVSRALQGLGAENRLILTGTPLQNNMVELWGLFHWLYPEVFTERTSELFKSSFDLTKGQVNTNVMDSARRLLELIMLRRMKKSPGVDLNLPPKEDVLLYVPLTPMQRFWYMRLLTGADKGLLDDLFKGAAEKEAQSLDQESKENPFLKQQESTEKEVHEAISAQTENEALAGSAIEPTNWSESKEIMRRALDREREDANRTSAWRKLMNILMQLRKCCNHPYILPNAAPDPYYLGDHVIHASAKLILLDKIINQLVIKQKKKILIFSGFTRMLDCCEDFLALRGGNGDVFKYSRLDGGTGSARRNLGIRLFNQAESMYKVMLISTRAGGLGINLASASDVILLDHDWNPQIMLQAEARAHRIGQKNPVTVYKLCTQGTVEEQMLGRIQKKLYLSAKVTESMRDIRFNANGKRGSKGINDQGLETEDLPQLGTNELMSLVRRGAQTLAHPELDVDEMASWDWQTTLERCKDRPASIQVSDASREADEKKWLSQMEQIQSRVFEGKELGKKKAKDQYGSFDRDWDREARRMGKNTTVMVDGFAISKESMSCADWEAVPTFAGKDPRLAEPKRGKKAAIENQDFCQSCWDGGEVIMCTLCPRSYHYECLDRETQKRARSKFAFSCPQHSCADCQRKTTDAGGMLYRCRTCERAFCEDCLDFEKAVLLGDNLKEYELLGFPAVSQAFYVNCSTCANKAVEEADDVRERRELILAETEHKYDNWLNGEVPDAAEVGTPSGQIEAPELDHDGDTLNTSGIVTPKELDPEPEVKDGFGTQTRKRKAILKFKQGTAAKEGDGKGSKRMKIA